MISTVLLEFQTEIQELINLDQTNQLLFSPAPPATPAFTRPQLATLTEGIFLKSYTCFEQFTRKVFLKYCCNESTSVGTAVTSYLNPRNENHAEEIIRSSLPFLDWNTPDKLIDRSECYLENHGFPIKDAIIASKSQLQQYKSIRNHVAHNSSESSIKYSRILQEHYGTLPLVLPSPGEFLLEFERPRRGVARAYKLQSFFALITNLSQAMAAV
jgi:hypothetical protein